VNSTYGTNYTDEDLYCYNQSFYDIDGDNLTALYRWYNESGPMPGQTNWNLSYELTVVNHNYTCVVWAYDGFDNSTPANATITIREGLIINITSPRNGTTINYSYHVLFNFTVSMVANCSYKLDDGDYVSVWNVTNYNTTFNIYVNGLHNITVNCTSGSMNETEITIFTINDTTPPNIIDSSPSGILYVSRINLTVTTDENATCRYIRSTEGNISTSYFNMTHNFVDNDLDHRKNMTLANGYYEFYARCIDNLGNVMNESENISFTIDVEIIEVIVPGGGGGGRREKNVTKKVLLELYVSSNQTLFSADEISVLVTLKNKGEVVLYNISLATQTNAPNVSLSLSDILFDKLSIGEENNTILKIESLVTPKARIGINRYFVVLNAHVAEPVYDTLTRFFVDVEEIDYALRMENLRQIQFAQDLFKEHPECLEFNEVIKQAQGSYDNYDYRGSLSLIESAINACRALIVYKGGEEYEKWEEVIEGVEKPALKGVDTIIFIIEMIILLAIILTMLYYYKKGKSKKPKPPKRVAKSNLESRFEDLFKETKKFIRIRNLTNAREGYLRLYSLYKTMRASSLPDYIKSDSHQKLLIIRSKLLRIINK